MSTSRSTLHYESRQETRCGLTSPTAVAERAKEVWAYDFVFDTYADGPQVKCLTLIDEYTRECLAIDVAGSIRSGPVIGVLSRLASETRYLRSDNGPGFVSKALLRGAANESLGVVLIDAR
ncbi:hypothetical protein DesfrDRAFT_2396 [Solidesulfovibrio fructosivorans JJ]]|uniref:Integrase catalytic domain-containing protein n=1 Tax=Solidesulfovibrio fructosivorans JJ] TaxID=596151 RepID=E1JXP7_SOLFR|nr:hypothetical protein DesfrDRAFT_2396 [Solidesulfovibrio fructosivorans JJ]]